MTIQELAEDAQDFMDYYVLGGDSPRAQAAFPGSGFPGIKFRAPAALGIRPEYEPLPNPLDGTVVTAGSDGPEGVGPYIFLDVCPFRKAVVTLQGGTVMVEFVCVVQYPPNRFPDLDRAKGNEVRLPTNVFTLIASECLSKFEDCVQFEPGGGFPVGYSITVVSLDEFDKTDG